jgi:hypothetical protein
MLDPVEKYLDRVMIVADLARGDQRAVRAELKEHLQTLISTKSHLTEPEIYTMLTNEFGEPTKIGRSIAQSKGRVLTYLKKKRRTLPIQLAVTLVVLLAVRFSVAQEFYVPSDVAAPMIPRGSRILVYKLAESFQQGDVVVFRSAGGEAWMGTVETSDAQGNLTVSRKGYPQSIVPRRSIIGRVVLNTR